MIEAIKIFLFIMLISGSFLIITAVLYRIVDRILREDGDDYSPSAYVRWTDSVYDKSKRDNNKCKERVSNSHPNVTVNGVNGICDEEGRIVINTEGLNLKINVDDNTMTIEIKKQDK